MDKLQDYLCSKIPLCDELSNIYWIKILAYLITVAILIGVALLVFFGIKLFILNIIRNILNKRRSEFLKIIARNKTLKTLTHIACSYTLWAGIKAINQSQSFYLILFRILHYMALTYFIISISILISRLIWSANEYYEKKFIFANQYPIYTYLRVFILFFWAIVIMLILATLADTSPFALLTGIGAASAVFLLIFRDTLLGIVSSIQVAASGIIRPGDRIAIDKYGIDGNVTSIAITTVKVQNADNTVATIPTYTLTSEVVKNWRGMEESGGRRIKRSIIIDIDSIMACNKELLESLSQANPTLAIYIMNNAQKEIINLAIYREYMLNYLQNHPLINSKFLIMVRHLEPSIHGLPLEIYAFTKSTDIVGYEIAQAEIFEHCFAALSRFNLKILQYNS